MTETITQIQDQYVAELLAVPAGPGRYGNNRKRRRAIKERFFVETSSLFTVDPNAHQQWWQDVKDMVVLKMFAEE